MAKAEEETPLLSKAGLGNGIKDTGAGGSLWDSLGPVASAILCLPVLLAH